VVYPCPRVLTLRSFDTTVPVMNVARTRLTVDLLLTMAAVPAGFANRELREHSIREADSTEVV
jgi:hypothetical protein